MEMELPLIPLTAQIPSIHSCMLTIAYLPEDLTDISGQSSTEYEGCTEPERAIQIRVVVQGIH